MTPRTPPSSRPKKQNRNKRQSISNGLLPPKSQPNDRDVRFFVASLAVAPLELIIGQSGASGLTLLSIEAGIAASLLLLAIFWRPVGLLLPTFFSLGSNYRITGSTWLCLILALFTLSYLADLGAKIGIQPNLFSVSHTSDKPETLTLSKLNAHARLHFGPGGSPPYQEGTLENVWSWTAVSNTFSLQVNGQVITSTLWTVTIIFAEPLLIRTLEIKDQFGSAVVYTPQYIDPKYAVFVVGGDLSQKILDVKTSP